MKQSIIWTKLSDIEFISLVNESNSYKQIFNVFGLCNKGGNSKTLKQRISKLNLNTDHLNASYTKLNELSKLKVIPLVDILVENSTYDRTRLKRRLITSGILENKCSICDQMPVWNNKPLTLQLDHINGIHNDNRIHNIRIVCPHCHTQTDTYAGRSNKKIYKCICGNKKTKLSIECNICMSIRHRKVIRPSIDVLIDKIKSSSYVAIGKEYGVSDNAIRKWIKSYGFNPKTFDPI